MSIVPGSKIGKFKLQDQLGGGGMGSVYKARDTQLGRIVAIKILTPSMTTTSRILSALNAKHAPSLHSIIPT